MTSPYHYVISAEHQAWRFGNNDTERFGKFATGVRGIELAPFASAYYTSIPPPSNKVVVTIFEENPIDGSAKFEDVDWERGVYVHPDVTAKNTNFEDKKYLVETLVKVIGTYTPEAGSKSVIYKCAVLSTPEVIHYVSGMGDYRRAKDLGQLTTWLRCTEWDTGNSPVKGCLDRIRRNTKLRGAKLRSTLRDHLRESIMGKEDGEEDRYFYMGQAFDLRPGAGMVYDEEGSVMSMASQNPLLTLGRDTKVEKPDSQYTQLPKRQTDLHSLVKAGSNQHRVLSPSEAGSKMGRVTWATGAAPTRKPGTFDVEEEGKEEEEEEEEEGKLRIQREIIWSFSDPSAARKVFLAEQGKENDLSSSLTAHPAPPPTKPAWGKAPIASTAAGASRAPQATLPLQPNTVKTPARQPAVSAWSQTSAASTQAGSSKAPVMTLPAKAPVMSFPSKAPSKAPVVTFPSKSPQVGTSSAGKNKKGKKGQVTNKSELDEQDASKQAALEILRKEREELITKKSANAVQTAQTTASTGSAVPPSKQLSASQTGRQWPTPTSRATQKITILQRPSTVPSAHGPSRQQTTQLKSDLPTAVGDPSADILLRQLVQEQKKEAPRSWADADDSDEDEWQKAFIERVKEGPHPKHIAEETQLPVFHQDKTERTSTISKIQTTALPVTRRDTHDSAASAVATATTTATPSTATAMTPMTDLWDSQVISTGSGQITRATTFGDDDRDDMASKKVKVPEDEGKVGDNEMESTGILLLPELSLGLGSDFGDEDWSQSVLSSL